MSKFKVYGTQLLSFITLLLIIGLTACSNPAAVTDPVSSTSSVVSAGYQNSAPAGGDVIADQYIVELKKGTVLADSLKKGMGYAKRQQHALDKISKLVAKYAVTKGDILNVYASAIEGFSVKLNKGQLAKIRSLDMVKRIEPDQTVSLLPTTGVTVKAVTALADTVPWGVARVNGGVDATGKVAWVIDTGIDLDHPDLNVDAARGITFIRGTRTANDDNGHGSHVAGIIAAKNDGQGIVGVAANATLIPVKVLDRRGSGTISGVIAGVDYVAANGAAGEVANMSLGGGVSTTLDDAVYNASQTGVIFTLAAGNESDDANFHSPARVNGPYIYTISAFDSSDTFAYFSNYGNPPIDYSAPGVSIYSTYEKGGYATLSGTSMAAPHAAGVLLLGQPRTDGFVSGDLDNQPDPIIVH